MKAQIRIAFENDLLIIGATANYSALPRLAPNASDKYMPEARVVRKYPVTELTARSEVFKGASAINFVEQHMLDKLRLEIFEAGYDARGVEFEIEHVASLHTTDSHGAHHSYKWVHDEAAKRLILMDGIHLVADYATIGLNYASCMALADSEAQKSASPAVAIAG
jgi:hypothetical protein